MTCAPLLSYTSSRCEQWFPGENQDRIKDFAIGIIVGLSLFVVLASATYLLEANCTWFSSYSQDAIAIFNIFQDIHPILNLAWKGIWRAFVVIVGPITEEVLFRGVGNDLVEGCMGENQTTLKKVLRVAFIAILFGAAHLSPFQNTVTNVTIFGIASIIGLVLGVLKEKSQGLSAPIGAHIAFNLAATL